MHLFLLGAGFNVDADCGYPLLEDLKLYFEHSQDKSVEDLFSDALRNNDYEPLEKLAERLMDADRDVAEKLASSSQTLDCYREFFRKFAGAQFLSFNYDSLPEIFLTQLGRWHPEDGYGVPVATERQSGTSLAADATSASLVLHLHGSLCVFTAEFGILGNRRGHSLYGFDADSITRFFPGYRRMMSNTGYVRIDERVVAPVPDKSEGLKQDFVRETNLKAAALIREAGTLVTLGYGFNIHDRSSYDPILQALERSHDRTLFIVSLKARTLAPRIAAEYPSLRVKPIGKAFRTWAADSFRTHRCVLARLFLRGSQ